MKWIIDISEEVKNRLCFGITYQKDIQTVCKALNDGTSIPDNATNGDVLISLYPNLKYTIQNGRVVTTIGVASSFDLDWWNSPYQKGGNG